MDMEASKPKTTLEQLREIRDAQLKEVEEKAKAYETAKDELKRLDKAIKQWDKKE